MWKLEFKQLLDLPKFSQMANSKARFLTQGFGSKSHVITSWWLYSASSPTPSFLTSLSFLSFFPKDISFSLHIFPSFSV